MNNLEQALNTKFTATLLGTFTGNVLASGGSGLHWEQAPSEALPPLLIASIINSPASSKYGGVLYSEITISFRSIATGRTTAIANMETFIATFDEFIPTLSSGSVSNVTREQDPLAMKFHEPENRVSRTTSESDEAGNDYYQAIVIYRYTLTA